MALHRDWRVPEQPSTSDRERARSILNAVTEAEHRLAPHEAQFLLTSAPQEELLAAADTVRARLHPEGVVTYVVDRNVNYSNVCSSVCAFCAFYRKPGDPEGYVLSHEQIFHKVEETLALGGSGILMQGGLHPDLPLSYYTELFRGLKQRFPRVYLHCLSPTEVYGLTQVTGLSTERVLMELRDAGLDSIPGGGGEILVDEIRQRRRSSCTSEQWLATSAAAHRAGLPTTATMMFGLGEHAGHRIEHLARLRAVQDETAGFISFIPWTFQPDNTALGRALPERVPVPYYLRVLAVSRLFLDNLRNLQVSWLTQGLDGGRAGLHAGANDVGSIMIEENVISVAGAHHCATEHTLRGLIESAGFRPALRNGGYHRLPDRRVPEVAR